MRNNYAQLGLLIMLGSAIVKANTESLALKGSWSLTKRICTGESVPNDKFHLGRDSMVLEITEDKLITHVIIESESSQKSYLLKIDGSKLKLAPDGGSSIYAVSQNNELIIFSADFGKGGTCNEGEGLMSVFKKIDRDSRI